MEMDTQRAYTVFVVQDGELVMAQHGRGFPDSLATYLWFNSPTVDGDTHIAQFLRGNGPASGELTNTMPGSEFTKFEFEKATLLGVTVIVGRYE